MPSYQEEQAWWFRAGTLAEGTPLNFALTETWSPVVDSLVYRPSYVAHP